MSPGQSSHKLVRRFALPSSVGLVALVAACGDVAPTEPISHSTQAQTSALGKYDPKAVDEPDPKTHLLPWASYAFRKRTFSAAELAKDATENRIQIKFVVGSGVRSRNGSLTIDEKEATEVPNWKALDSVRAVLDKYGHKATVRMHLLSENRIKEARKEGQLRTGRDVPDLNLWFYAYVEPKDAEHLSQLLGELNENPLVELAYPCYLPVHPGMGKAAQAATEVLRKHARHLAVPTKEEIAILEKGIEPKVLRDLVPPAPPTPPPAPPGDYSPLQHYAADWPRGINARSAQQTYIGSDGINSGYADVEYAWRTTHQDLTSISASDLVHGAPGADVDIQDFRNHGTAVIGALSAADNGFGVIGLTPEAEARLSTEWPASGPNRPAAISTASANLWVGGAILLEMQMFAGFDCNGDNIAAATYNEAPLPDLVPAEHDPAVKDAVKFATAAGRHVVAAGGNGGCNLDGPGFLGAFDMYDEELVNATVNAHDSGAILEGAGGADVPAAYWTDFSTYGSRTDVQAQGDYQIVSTGYGDLYNNNNDEDTFYTAQFAGTSGVGPIITGAVVAMEGVLFNNHGSAYSPKELRRILRRHSSISDLRLKTVWDAQNPNGPGPGFVLRSRIARPDLMEVNEQMKARHFCGRSSDFDGDGKADYALYRTSRGSNGLWRIRFSTGGESTYQWGQRGDIPCPADVVGDARTELIVFRPSTGEWHIKNLQNGSTQVIAFGTYTDIPIAMDYDGDGKANLAVVDRYTHFPYAHWIIRDQNQNLIIGDESVGEFDSTPLTADVDGDGRDDMLSFRAGTWEVLPAYNPGYSTLISFGQLGDIPRIRHLNGSDQLALYRPDEGKFYFRSSSNQVTSVQYGVPGDIPILADVTGDGTDENIVFRAPYAKTYGMDSDQPLFFQQGLGVVWSRAYEVTWIPVMQ